MWVIYSLSAESIRWELCGGADVLRKDSLLSPLFIVQSGAEVGEKRKKGQGERKWAGGTSSRVPPDAATAACTAGRVRRTSGHHASPAGREPTSRQRVPMHSRHWALLSSRPGNRFGEISIAFAFCAPLPMQGCVPSACEVVQSRRGEGTPGLTAATASLHISAQQATRAKGSGKQEGERKHHSDNGKRTGNVGIGQGELSSAEAAVMVVVEVVVGVGLG